jgi:hypothetical protein
MKSKRLTKKGLPNPKGEKMAKYRFYVFGNNASIRVKDGDPIPTGYYPISLVGLLVKNPLHLFDISVLGFILPWVIMAVFLVFFTWAFLAILIPTVVFLILVNKCKITVLKQKKIHIPIRIGAFILIWGIFFLIFKSGTLMSRINDFQPSDFLGKFLKISLTGNHITLFAPVLIFTKLLTKS